ncbi:MAG: Wzz/FepE/Etk N-terminal domain-containing protein [candidate division Zixibacteria bacterium]|nr:Wzz/FepE/Etk N-terminal domain-containing protein [candidate division Zixibacteria bacterium]
MENLQTTNTFDVKDIFQIILRNKWILIIPIILSTIVAYGGSYYLTPKYQSSIIIWIDKPSSVSRELTNIIGSDRYTRESGADRQRKLQALRNEITSQTYLVQLIRDMKLDDDNDLTSEATKLSKQNPRFTIVQIKIDILLKKLRKQITVNYVGKNQIELTVESSDPVKAKDIANNLALIMESEKTKYEHDKLLDNQNFVDVQLIKKDRYYQKLLDSLAQARVEVANIKLSDEISSDENKRDIFTDIRDTENDISKYSNQVDGFANQLKLLGLEKSHLKYNEKMVQLRTDIDGQIIDYVNMMEKYPWTDRNVINKNIKFIDNVRQLESTVSTLVKGQFSSNTEKEQNILKNYFIAREYEDIFKLRKTHLQDSYDNLISEIDKLPRLETEIADLEGRAEEAREVRNAFSKEETTVGILFEQAKERTKYKVIEPAKVPLEPFWPDKNKIGILGFIMGLVIGGSSVLLKEILDSTFKKTEDVEASLGLPVIAVIPKIDKMKFR